VTLYGDYDACVGRYADTRVFHVTGMVSAIYRLSGSNCTSVSVSSQTAYTVGAEVPPSTFVQFN